jgi:hypothetical protein
MSKRKASFCIAAVVVVALAFGKALYPAAALTGIVFLDGQPLTEADLFLVGNETSNGATRSFSRTDSAGHFQIVNDLPPGEYRVVVRRLIGESPELYLLMTHGDYTVDLAQHDARISATGDAARRHELSSQTGSDAQGTTSLRQLPGIYSSPEQTVLRLQIPKSGVASVDLHLSISRG